MTRRVKPYHGGDAHHVELALVHLRFALRELKIVNCPRTIARVRLAISSAKGAVRNVGMRKHHDEMRIVAQGGLA